MTTDPIADLLTRIRNASKAHHEALTTPYSKLKENIVKIMQGKGIIEEYKIEKENDHKIISILFKDDTKKYTFKRISKPGQRIYIKHADLKQIKSGLGISIISTSKGLMTNFEAKKKNLGGEIICEIY